MTVEEALKTEINEVTAYQTPDGALYRTKDEAVKAILKDRSLAPYFALAWIVAITGCMAFFFAFAP
jgi:hypothetical protein